MVREKPPKAPPPIPLDERKRPPDASPTKTVISTPVSLQTKNRNLSLTRLEFTTKKNGATVNAEPLHKLVKKLLDHVFDADPTLEIYPIHAWPKQYTTVSSTVKTAPETDEHTEKTTEKNTKKNTEKAPTLTTPDTLPTDRTSFDKYFQYTSDEHHPGESAKIVVRFYSAGSKTLTELKDAATLDFLKQNNMWMNASHYDTLRESTPGWFLRVHPDATNRKDYYRDLHAFLSLNLEFGNGDVDDSFIPVSSRNKKPKFSSEPSVVTPVKTTPTYPPFSIVSKRTGTMGPATKGKKGEYIHTKVLQIRCETIHADRLQNILAAACDNNRLRDSFIPHSMKEMDPTLYLTAIQAQNAFLSSATAIRVDGLCDGALDRRYDGTDTTLRSIIDNSSLFFRVDETATSFRSEGRSLFVTDHTLPRRIHRRHSKKVIS
jgi:hypothetical protein